MKIKNIFIALLLCSNMFAQTNHIYGELFGPGLFSSINYERDLSLEKKVFVRMGYGFFSMTTTGLIASTKLSINPLILGVHKYWGNKWRFEVGGGISYWMIKFEGDDMLDFSGLNFDFEGSYPMYYASLGLRYQNPEGGLTMKLGLSPTIVSAEGQSASIISPHVGIGYAF